MRTLVVGLGNPILTDDGVGVRAASAIEAALASAGREEVTVVEASVGGLRLMELMVGYQRVILIDALMDRSSPLGTIRRLTLHDLQAISPTLHSASAHDTNLITALETGRRMGLPLPDEVIIYAVTVDNVTDFGEQLTPVVAAALPQLTSAVLAEIGLESCLTPASSERS